MNDLKTLTVFQSYPMKAEYFENLKQALPTQDYWAGTPLIYEVHYGVGGEFLIELSEIIPDVPDSYDLHFLFQCVSPLSSPETTSWSLLIKGYRFDSPDGGSGWDDREDQTEWIFQPKPYWNEERQSVQLKDEFEVEVETEESFESVLVEFIIEFTPNHL